MESIRRILGGAALGVCLVSAGGAGAASNGLEQLFQSTVCLLGDLPEGRFEASGFVVDDGHRIMTTAHGLEEAKHLRVKLHDGRIFPVRLDRIGNERVDLALLEVPAERLRPAVIGSVEDLSPGDPVRTIGCPGGFDFSITQGIVSSIRPSDLGYPLIQTDVPVNPGSSGGPLFDSRGAVVGIVKGSVAGAERIHFALPADLARALLDETRREREAFRLFNEGVAETDPEAKVGIYRKVVELMPDLPEARYNFGLALERAGRPGEAVRSYREALRLDPGSSAAALNMGALLHDEGRYADAIEVYEGALSHHPGSLPLRNNLAEAHRALGRFEEARRELDAILEIDPDYAPAHYGLALLHERKAGDRELTAKHLRRYLALAPDAEDAPKVREWLKRIEDETP